MKKVSFFACFSKTYWKNKFSIMAAILPVIVCFFIIFSTKPHKHNDVIIHDVIDYYGYLPSAFIYHDLTLSFLYDPNRDPAVNIWSHELPNGNRAFKMSMGTAIMYSPFFFAAHALAPLFGYPANGYSMPYSLAILFAAITYLFLGLLVLRKLLLKYYSDLVTGFTLLIIVLATNLLYYATIYAGMSHVYSFCLFAAFLFLTERWYTNPNYKNSILIGLIFGLVTLVRPTNAVVIILFALWGISNGASLKNRFQTWLQKWPQILVFIAFTLLVWAPQIIYWKMITGNFLYYSYINNERFFFNDPKIFYVLFGFRKGLIIYTPIMAFALIGIGLLWKYARNWFWGCVVYIPVNLYIISSWWCWWYGGGFGMRALIETYPVMALGLGAFLTWAGRQRKKWKIPLITVVAIISLLSVFHTVKYHYASIRYDNMTRETFWGYYWKVRSPEGLDEKLKPMDAEAAKRGARDE